MDGEVTAEQARELLDALVEGGGMKHIDTPLALRLIPLADDVGRDDLAAELMERAEAAASIMSRRDGSGSNVCADKVETSTRCSDWPPAWKAWTKGSVSQQRPTTTPRSFTTPTNRGKRHTLWSADRSDCVRISAMRKAGLTGSRSERRVNVPWNR